MCGRRGGGRPGVRVGVVGGQWCGLVVRWIKGGRIGVRLLSSAGWVGLALVVTLVGALVIIWSLGSGQDDSATSVSVFRAGDELNALVEDGGGRSLVVGGARRRGQLVSAVDRLVPVWRGPIGLLVVPPSVQGRLVGALELLELGRARRGIWLGDVPGSGVDGWARSCGGDARLQTWCQRGGSALGGGRWVVRLSHGAAVWVDLDDGPLGPGDGEYAGGRSVDNGGSVDGAGGSQPRVAIAVVRGAVSVVMVTGTGDGGEWSGERVNRTGAPTVLVVLDSDRARQWWGPEAALRVQAVDSQMLGAPTSPFVALGEGYMLRVELLPDRVRLRTRQL